MNPMENPLWRATGEATLAEDNYTDSEPGRDTELATSFISSAVSLSDVFCAGPAEDELNWEERPMKLGRPRGSDRI